MERKEEEVKEVKIKIEKPECLMCLVEKYPNVRVVFEKNPQLVICKEHHEIEYLES